ncbi:uncharacterized protein P884DRAFT_212792 [Thermothelomyces heterothallicus CBS 202.75]|uniref:uncharacterized protein n=1 Tax=Thermothelomyces heterothallicus CBS 202.75 TaxID=1149848 RepID=UPI00374247EC
MARVLSTGALLALLNLVTPGLGAAHVSNCRYIPGDKGWPSQSDWARLNRTVGGRLIATVPQAHVCHAGGPGVNQAACDALKDPLVFEKTTPAYVNKPAEIINAYWQNQSCDPFSETSRPCVLGNYPVYSINVSGAHDAIAGLDFARRQNIRLSIQNTGHDYNGRSAGFGSLSLWTHNLQGIEMIPQYRSRAYSGPAVKLGAGVHAGVALQYLGRRGYRLVTGECGTVGVAGGYSMGGGHGPLNGAYGMASDNVLEWEVVTGDGRHIVATPEKNSDIYWAMSGGGGGSYGVALSMTARIYRDGPVLGPVLTFTAPDVGNETYWGAVDAFLKRLPGMLRGSSTSIQFSFWNNQFGALFVMPDERNSSAADAKLAPLLRDLDAIGIPYDLTVSQSETFLDYYSSWYGPLPFGYEPPSTTLNSRLVPVRVAQDDQARRQLIDAMRLTTQTGEFTVGCSAADVGSVRHPDNAVLPAWRKSVSICNVNAFWNWTAPLEQNLEVKRRMVDVYSPAWDAATPGSGVYLNEIDPWYRGDFKVNMFGSNYRHLLSIKHKYDPYHLFYGHNSVGSDDFSIDGAGRLCYSSGR